MSDKRRWRYGDTNSVVAAVDGDTVIEIGDMVWQDVDDAKPAAMIPKPEREYANISFAEMMQEYFATNFLGVAMQRSRFGEADPMRVATTGVFEFYCPSGTFELGNLIGPAVENIGADNEQLENQVVGPASAARYAIARVDKRVASAASLVLVRIFSTVMTGGV